MDKVLHVLRLMPNQIVIFDKYWVSTSNYKELIQVLGKINPVVEESYAHVSGLNVANCIDAWELVSIIEFLPWFTNLIYLNIETSFLNTPLPMAEFFKTIWDMKSIRYLYVGAVPSNRCFSLKVKGFIQMMDVKIFASQITLDYGTRYDVLPYWETAVNLYVHLMKEEYVKLEEI